MSLCEYEQSEPLHDDSVESNESKEESMVKGPRWLPTYRGRLGGAGDGGREWKNRGRRANRCLHQCWWHSSRLVGKCCQSLLISSQQTNLTQRWHRIPEHLFKHTEINVS